MKYINISAACCNSLHRFRIQANWILAIILITGACSSLRSEQSPTVSAVRVSSGYILGPNDEITVSVVELPEFRPNVSYRIDEDGTVSLPLLGRVQAGGLTLAQVEGNLRAALQTLVREPHFVANVVESKSRFVSIMGPVNTPGSQSIQGSKTLFDAIASAGGLKTDAGDYLTITRSASEGPLNLPNEFKDPATGNSSARVNIRDILDLRDPRLNIAVRSHDEIAVSRARVLYVIGNVKKPGGFTLTSGHPLSALEAVSLAEGLSQNAAAENARILRRDESDKAIREQIPLNLKKILAGKNQDVQLSADDILYVPDNTTRRVTIRVLETVLVTVSGLLVYRGL